MQRTELEQQMTGRVRRHLLASVVGFVVALLLMVIAGAGARAAFGTDQPLWARLLPVLGIVLIPVIGLRSTFKYLRCPACDRMVALQVSANYSVFGARANRNCNACGKK